MTSPTIDLTFPHRWRAEILAARPLILPPRHFVYPREVEEVERGALELLIHPQNPGAPGLASETWESNEPKHDAEQFLATCALGFRDPAVPTGIWSTPNPQELCAVAGGYAYLIDTTAPERFTMLEVRPVLQVLAARDVGLLLFVGHHTVLAWGAQGHAWESPKLSDEGITNARVEGEALHGLGWSMMTDKETPFCLDLQTGRVRNAA